MRGVESIPEPEGGAVKWRALGQAICHEAEEDKTILTTTNWMLICARYWTKFFKAGLLGVGSQEEEGKEFEVREGRPESQI